MKKKISVLPKEPAINNNLELFLLFGFLVLSTVTVGFFIWVIVHELSIMLSLVGVPGTF